jgi:serine/threonine protein kinase/DNA-binding SARP family transcriptional activator
MIRLSVLGKLDLRDDARGELDAVLSQPKRFGLLVYLSAARPHGFHRRDTLLALFWPELDEAHARNSLNQALRFLRQELGPNAITSRGQDEVGIDPAHVWCDAVAVHDAVAAGRLEEALAYFGGEPFKGLHVTDARTVEEWLDGERNWLRQHEAEAARSLAERAEQAGDLTVAVRWGRRAAELARDDERAFRRLFALLARVGDRAGALQAYDDFAVRLRDELGVEPASETQALADKFRRDSDHGSVNSPSLDAPQVREARGGQSLFISSPAASPPERGNLLSEGRYVIEGMLGAGAMATVHLAHDVRHDRRVAVKVLRPKVAAAIGSAGFLREIRIAAALQHPHIVPVFDSGESDGRVFYVMPHVAGESLHARLARERTIAIGMAVRIARDIAEALAHAHNEGIVHRDIKPGNVLLSGDPVTDEWNALVADFGVANAVDSWDTSTAAVSEGSLTEVRIVGSPKYMAPEQAAGGDIDCRADVYAWAVVAYEMFAGEHPFAARRTPQQLIAAHLIERPAAISEKNEALPPGLATLVMRCLEKDPMLRPANGAEVAAALDRALIAEPRPQSARPVSPVKGSSGRSLAKSHSPNKAPRVSQVVRSAIGAVLLVLSGHSRLPNARQTDPLQILGPPAEVEALNQWRASQRPLGPGMRYYAIPVFNTQEATRKLEPNSVVHVFLFADRPNQPDPGIEYITSARVKGISAPTVVADKDGADVSVTLMLEVTTEQFNRLIAATARGQFSVVLPLGEGRLPEHIAYPPNAPVYVPNDTIWQAHAFDTAAVLTAVATYHIRPTLERDVKSGAGGLRAGDSTTLAALQAAFAVARRPTPPLSKDPPPCGGMRPPPPNDRSEPGYTLRLQVYRAADDSALVYMWFRCRYDERTFLRSELLLLKRGPAGWRVERTVGTGAAG